MTGPPRHRHPAGRGAPDARDGIVAAFAAAVGLLVAHVATDHAATVCVHGHCFDVVGGLDAATAMVLLASVALLWRSRAPRASLAVIALLVTIEAGLGQLALALLPALVLAWAEVVRRHDRLAAWATVVLAVFVWVPLSFGVSHFAAPVAWLIVIAFGVEMRRTRRGRRIAQDRSREETSLRRAEEERLRIARELHDVLAHNISLINVQSGVALHLLGEHPEQARPALSIINEASGEALRELRSVLGVLRRVDESAPRRPTAGLDRLDELIAHSAAAGVTVDVTTRGEPRPLATPVDLAAFRIVQESLTNVARHAGPGHASVVVDYGTDALTVEIADDGGASTSETATDAATSGTGNGILGMRERAAALGGTLWAGPRPEGSGFRVHARLPYRGGG